MYRSDLNLRYDKEFEYGEDVKLFLDYTYNGGRVYSLKDVLCEYYIHDEQISQRLMCKNRRMTRKIQNHYIKLKGGGISKIIKFLENVN